MANEYQPWEPLYYLTHDGIEGDAEFYRHFLGPIGAVLELGCGHGRLTKGFLALGHRVTALDRSQYALDTLKTQITDPAHNELLNCVRSDFTDFPTTEMYDRIVLSFNGLLCLSDTEKLRLFQMVASHLARDGCFLFDLYDGTDFVESTESDEEWVYDPHHIKTVKLGKSAFDVYESGQFRSGEGRLEMHYHYFPEGQDELDDTLSYTIVHYPLSEAKLRHLMGQAGLRIRQIISTDQHDNPHLFVVSGG